MSKYVGDVKGMTNAEIADVLNDKVEGAVEGFGCEYDTCEEDRSNTLMMIAVVEEAARRLRDVP